MNFFIEFSIPVAKVEVHDFFRYLFLSGTTPSDFQNKFLRIYTLEKCGFFYNFKAIFKL